MEIKILFTIIISTIFINNYVLSQMLGLCPFLGVSKKIDSAIGMGMAVIFVMTLASFITFLIYKYILIPYNIDYLRTVTFILIIASLVQLVEMIIEKVSPSLYQSLGIFLPLITTNCAVIGVAILNISSGFAEVSNCSDLITVSEDGKHFVQVDTGRKFTPWGFNYDQVHFSFAKY